ncbi:MAG: hypothetical protein Q8P13_05335 [bacterium]|nr:hypothetical protein [bacterium]
MSKDSEERSDGIFKGLLFGVLLGVGLSWFFSTPQGKEFKKKLEKEGNKILDQTKEKLDSNFKEE